METGRTEIFHGGRSGNQDRSQTMEGKAGSRPYNEGR